MKEVYATATGPMTTGTVSHADTLAGWFVMVKDSKNSHPGNKLWGSGWAWSWFDAKDPLKTTSTDYKTDCQPCHIPAQATDWIYTQGYPFCASRRIQPDLLPRSAHKPARPTRPIPFPPRAVAQSFRGHDDNREIGRAPERHRGRPRGNVHMTGRFVRPSILAFAAALASAPLVSAARAGDFSAEYVFGDSLSDNGNLAELLNFEGQFSGNFPNPPSFHDSFTNGPVAVAGLAQNLGLSLTPSLWVTGFKDPAGLFGGVSFMPGTNYAVAGALSATPSPVSINLLSQVGAYSAYASGHADPDALYVIMIGGNDVRDAALDGTGQAAVTTGVTAELAAISTLSGEDAKHFLVVNVPNVGIIPEFAQDHPTLAASATA